MLIVLMKLYWPVPSNHNSFNVRILRQDLVFSSFVLLYQETSKNMLSKATMFIEKLEHHYFFKTARFIYILCCSHLLIRC